MRWKRRNQRVRQWWGGCSPQFWYYIPASLILIVINLCVHIFFQHIITAYFTLELFPFVSWQMNPLMRRCSDPKLRRRRILTFCAVGCKWGVSCSSRGGGMGASVRGEFTLFSLSFSSHVAFYFPLHPYPCIFFHLSGTGFTEKGWLPEGGGPQTGDGGAVLGDWVIGKDGSSSGRFRGRGFLW